jgi:hypothetical protein
MDVVPGAPLGVTSDDVGDATGERVSSSWPSDLCGAGRRWCISTTAADTGGGGWPTGERADGRGLGPTGTEPASAGGLSLPRVGPSDGGAPSGWDVPGSNGGWPGTGACGDRGCIPAAAGPASRSRARGAGRVPEGGRGAGSGDERTSAGDGDGDVECGDAILEDGDRLGRATTWLEGSGRDGGAARPGRTAPGRTPIVAAVGSGARAGAPRRDGRGRARASRASGLITSGSVACAGARGASPARAGVGCAPACEARGEGRASCPALPWKGLAVRTGREARPRAPTLP